MQQPPNFGGSRSEDAQRLQFISQALMPETTKKIAVMNNIAILILGWLSLSLEVFVRRDFGERYLGYLRLAFTGFLLAFYFGFLSLFSADYNYQTRTTNGGPLSAVFLLAFLGAAIYHRIRINRRKRAEEEWYSYDFGTSRLAGQTLFRVTNDWTLYRVWEPLVFLILGTIIAIVLQSPVGIWMQAASVALAIKNQLMFAQEYNIYLDLIDARIRAKYFTEAAQGKPKSETKGFTVIPANYDMLLGDGPFDMSKTVAEALRNNATNSNVQQDITENSGQATMDKKDQTGATPEAFTQTLYETLQDPVEPTPAQPDMQNYQETRTQYPLPGKRQPGHRSSVKGQK